ncbi:MAG TPA: hypothetical protein VNT32_08740, partial [Thermoleophilaceae bacterium]|nr:hypothetical protein [Thermoleophilaceae bacterium]
MTARRRNFAIIATVLALLTLSLLLVVPGAPFSKATRLGLDLKGGVELVYEGRATPKVPEVTPQALDDAIDTIRKRTDTLGVSEPEIQRAGSNQISVGLPDVDNAERAIEQVGTTAQLQFYDWEPNVVGEDSKVLGEAGAVGPEGLAAANTPLTGTQALFEATQRAAEAKPLPEADDIPP